MINKILDVLNILINKLIKIFKKEEIIYFGITLILLIFSMFFIEYKKGEVKNLVINEYSLENKQDKIVVYLDGEVNNKGVYYLEKHITIKELLDYTGGVTDRANLNKIDLNELIKNGSKIVVPKSYDYD